MYIWHEHILHTLRPNNKINKLTKIKQINRRKNNKQAMNVKHYRSTFKRQKIDTLNNENRLITNQNLLKSCCRY